MHRSAIAEEYRGSGMSGYLIKCVEELTRSHGRRYIRIDTHRNNKPMQKLLRSSGYRYGGISSSPASRGTTRTGRPLKKY